MDLANWQYNWYGHWREKRGGRKEYPSIFDAVDAERVAGYDLIQLKQYLNEGFLIALTSSMSFSNPFNGNRLARSSLGLRTDGSWIWFDDLLEYIENNNVAIPDRWYQEIKDKQFIMDPQLEEKMAKVDHISFCLSILDAK